MRTFSPLPTSAARPRPLPGRGGVRACAVGVLASLYIGQASSASLEVDEGVVVKFGSGASLVVRDRLVTGPGLVLTSLRDDAVGGQAGTTPQTAAPGDWRGLRLEKSSGGFGTSSWPDVWIRFAGSGDGYGLIVRALSPELPGLRIDDSLSGLLVTSGGKPTVTGSGFLRNGIAVDAKGDSQPRLDGAFFQSNSTQAVLNRSPGSPVSARESWWGDSTGPAAPAGNPSGRGDAVSSGVDFGAFLTAPAVTRPFVRLAAPAAVFEQRDLSVDLGAIGAAEYRVGEAAGIDAKPYQAFPIGRATATVTVSDVDGEKSLIAQFRNAAGGSGSAALTLLYDVSPPVVVVTSPAEGATVGGTVDVQVNATDGSGIARVDFYLDNQLQFTDTAEPFVYRWDTTNVVIGAHFWRVVAVDKAGRQAEVIRNLVVQPVADVEGPTVTDLRLDGQPLVAGASVARDGVLQFLATDRSGVARVELLVDAVVVAAATSTGGGSFTVPLLVAGLANGPHVLGLRGTDSLGNVSTIELPIVVARVGPQAPTLLEPVSGLVTNSASLGVQGQAVPQSAIQMLRNGIAEGATVVTGTNGRFSTTVTLQEGANQLQATATDAYGTSAPSAAVTVTLDRSVPAAPSGLAAAAQVEGRIRLTWAASSDGRTDGYHVYRATAAFSDVALATRVTAAPLKANSLDDLPESDGNYHYRVVAVNSLGSMSAPSNPAQAVSDRTPPRASSLTYAPTGKVDPVTGRVGQGRVDLTLVVTEPLLTVPYLAIAPQGTPTVPVTLTQTSPTRYTGSFTVDATTGSGTVAAIFSARDPVGNRGTVIDAAGTLVIDTAGPAIASVTLVPGSPLRNDGTPPVQATFALSKPVKTGTAPDISYLLSGPVRTPIKLSGLAPVDATTWRATFTLPGDAGLSGPENLSFSHRTVDDLDNVSTRIEGSNRFQVYQGELPPAEVPFGLTAKAQPGGKVLLSWFEAADAGAYQVYRQAPGQAGLQPLVRTGGVSLVDQTPADGLYRYALASVRTANGQESLSAQTAPVEVTALSVAPGVPQNLALVLTSRGIQATWLAPPGGAVASYNLYRARGPVIGSVQGLTPYKPGLKETLVVDGSPDPEAAAYVVTAVDAAGNESGPSNSAYLNPSLLPVSELSVEQVGDQLPRLRWAAPRSAVSGYVVDVGQGSARIRLTPTPIGGFDLEDTGFTSGERLYTVSTVDAAGLELPRTLLLPDATVQVASGLPLRRGLMNRLQLQVTNLSSQAMENARVVIRLPRNADGSGPVDHPSASFTLPASGTRIVPVVVGGYATLADAVDMQIRLEVRPADGELARIVRTQRVSVTDGSLVVGMVTEDFTRGAQGKVRLRVENTSEVDVELLTARGNGSAPSDELRFKLIDPQGNVLATQSYLQVFGGSVVTLANGLTVARIPAGSVYTSDLFSMAVPSACPGSVRLRLEVDALRYRTGEEDQVVIEGRGSDKSVTLLETSYYGEVLDAQPSTSFGDVPVTITGRAIERRSGVPLPNARLTLVLNQEGFERTQSVLAGADGSFSYVFRPAANDAGSFRVSAVHPDVSDRPEQKSFTIQRVSVSPPRAKIEIPRNYPFTIPFTVSAGPATNGRNIALRLDAEAQPGGAVPAGLTLSLSPPVSLLERQTAGIPATLSADNQAQPSGTLVLRLYSDDRPGVAIGEVTLHYTLREAEPFVVSSPGLLDTGVLQGASQLESLKFSNQGLQEARNLRFELRRPDGSAPPTWATITSSASGLTLAPAESRSVDLNFAPPASTPEGTVELRLRVTGDNVPEQSVPVFVRVVKPGTGSPGVPDPGPGGSPTGVGGVLFKLSDLFTATLDSSGQLIQGLAGARVTIQNEDYPNILLELTSDSIGEALFQGVPAGRYVYRAGDSKHQEIGGRFQIKPGVVVTQPVFLTYNLITVEWSVREITIQDRYEITLTATFETDVPAPVVVLSPTSVNLPVMNEGEVFYGTLTLQNYGLVRADNVRQILPASDPYFRYEFLAPVPTELEAKQRVTLPYRVVAVKSLGGSTASGPSQSARSAPSSAISSALRGGQQPMDVAPVPAPSACWNYEAHTRVDSSFVCANGVLSEQSTSTTWYSVVLKDCQPGQSVPGGGSGGWWSGGWSGGSVGGGGTSGGGTASPGSSGGGTTGPPATPIPIGGPKSCTKTPDGKCS